MTAGDEAIVVRSTGSWYQIKDQNGVTYDARIRGKFRLHGKTLTNPVAVGDLVLFEIENENENTALIKKILPRQNYVVRQSPRKKHQLHLLASNIDQAILVITIREPNLKQGVIDRFLLMTEPHDIPAIIIFNKKDIYNEGDLNLYEYLADIYNGIGYPTYLISSLDSEDALRVENILLGKTTLISGQSGVGKSTFINAMYPDLDLRTTELSESSGKGQHTTTFATMYSLEHNTRIIDTPGFKSLSFNNLEPMDVAHNFREFFELSDNCRFNNCMHRDEPGCAIVQGMETEVISELRYANYLQILDEIEDQNYWERHADL